jgi:hypothetical protein
MLQVIRTFEMAGQMVASLMKMMIAEEQGTEKLEAIIRIQEDLKTAYKHFKDMLTISSGFDHEADVAMHKTAEEMVAAVNKATRHIYQDCAKYTAEVKQKEEENKLKGKQVSTRRQESNRIKSQPYVEKEDACQFGIVGSCEHGKHDEQRSGGL